MAALPLLGPPEIRSRTPSLPKTQLAATVTDDPFVDLMVTSYNRTRIAATPPMGETENKSPTYLSSGNPCLDFFFHVVPSTSSESMEERLNAAWAHDPLTTLKLVFHLRDLHGTGKSDKEGFYKAAFWLHQNHPKSLACNISSLEEFGYLKDLPEILYRLLEGAHVRKDQKAEWKQRKRDCWRICHGGYRGGGGGGRRGRGRGRGRGRFVEEQSQFRGPFQSKKHGKKPRGSRPSVTREIRVNNALQRNKTEKEIARVRREEKKIAMAKKVIDKYSHDPDFRFLHERVSDFFAERLKADMEYLKSGEINNISLAAKWCPSIDSSFDRALLLCESIARKVFNRKSYPEYEELEDAHYVYRVRDRLRKEVLVPLRKVLELPEVYIGTNRWNSINYNKVSSVTMKFSKEKFLKHDANRFLNYLEDVKLGNAKIAADDLLPHDIILSLNDGDGGQVAELQWKRMVDNLLEEGKFKNCLAICGVSGAMRGTPMEVSLALGLLVSELSEEPWKGKLITFSADPKLQIIEGETLFEKTQFVRGIDWGKNTDFQKVFDLILEIAVNGKLKDDQMIKRVFVFSEMEFDKASANSFETDYQVIVRKFKDKGYGHVIPEIVFWNLRDSKATPVPATQKGVALVGGSSKNLMKLFLNKDGIINPETVMEAAISDKEYQDLVVLD